MKKKLNKKKLAQLQTKLQQAKALHQQGKLQQASVSYQEILSLSPEHAEALYYSGYLKHQTGDNEAAEKQLRKAARLQPDNAMFFMGLGAVLEAQDNIKEAIKAFKKTVKLNPDIAEAHNNLGVVLRDYGKIEAAITHLRKALTIKQDYAEAYYNLGNTLADKGDNESAEQEFRNAIQYRPDYANALRNIALMHKYKSPEHKDIQHIESLLDKKNLPEQDRLTLHFALGKIFDDCKQYKQAFEHYQDGNKIKRRTLSFNIKKAQNFVDQSLKIFNSSLINKMSAWGSDSSLPVFIVGMPRSGTTLVEQIIASHTQAEGAGELLKIKEIKYQLERACNSEAELPQDIHQLEQHHVRTAAEDYLEFIKSYKGTDTLCITDKMPTNFLYLGLINILFPQARIIHCRRDPMDTCLSNYFQLYSRGNYFCYGLTELGKYYKEYERLMSHWHTLFPNRIFDIQYETLVSNTEHEAKKLIEFIGLDWNEQCLEFHRTKRAVQTASNWQVRKPIYSQSVKRWKNYEPFLEPLEIALRID